MSKDCKLDIKIYSRSFQDFTLDRCLLNLTVTGYQCRGVTKETKYPAEVTGSLVVRPIPTSSITNYAQSQQTGKCNSQGKIMAKTSVTTRSAKGAHGFPAPLARRASQGQPGSRSYSAPPHLACQRLVSREKLHPSFR